MQLIFKEAQQQQVAAEGEAQQQQQVAAEGEAQQQQQVAAEGEAQQQQQVAAEGEEAVNEVIQVCNILKSLSSYYYSTR